MRTQSRSSLWGLVASAAMFSSAAFAAPPSPAMLAHSCAGCHGTNGGSAGPTMPSLSSQSKTAIVDAMKKFKSGERPSTVMGRLAKGYSDAEIDVLGDFFAKQKFHPTSQTIDKAKAGRVVSD